MTITATPGCTLYVHKPTKAKKEVHLRGHKAFIYIQVSAAGSAEERSQQRFTPVSLLQQRSPSPTEMASGASLSGALLDCPPPRVHALLTHLHRGLNSIIKNDHQRAHCKQMTVAGAWRTNSARGHMQQQPARFCSLLLLFSSFFFLSSRGHLHAHFSETAGRRRGFLPDEESGFIFFYSDLL